jgi:uncharacterized membrane protein
LYFSKMNEQERLRQMQREIDQMKDQLRSQQEQISELQQRLVNSAGEHVSQQNQQTSQKKLSWSLENFIGLRLIHFIGIIVLVIGLSIGVKYAIDQELISERMRIIVAYGSGFVLYFLSVRLRKKYTVFSAILFSGAMASLYFTTYGAYVYYSMFSFAIAFIIMIVLTVYTVYEAISYNREEIALLGLVGAYGIPFLISKNAERADLFFLYISMINIAVIFLCVKKGWKNVGRTAQAITWLLFIGWASTRYNPALQWIAFLFMGFFFFLFLFTVASFKFFNKQSLTINDTYQLVMNNLALYIAALFVFGNSFANTDVALITLVLSVISGLQSLLAYYSWNEEGFTVRMLSSLTLSLFVIFIGFKWDGFTVTLLWLLTAIIVFIWGFRIRSVPARMTAIVLIGATLGKLLAFDSLSFSTIEKVIAYLLLGVLLLAVSFFYQKFREKIFEDK